MEQIETYDETVITTFILLGFGEAPELQIPLFLVFLLIYAMTVCANLILVLLVITDHHLHIPMYFFLGNLSCLGTLYSSTILPRMLSSFLTGDRTISIGGCFIQFYCFSTFLIAEMYVLASMSYDRYLAICKPLQYSTLMSERLYFLLSVAPWVWGTMVMTSVISLMSRLKYCGPHEIDHFFCDLIPLINLSCSDTTLVTLAGLIASVIYTYFPSFMILLSYVCIIAVIVKMPSAEGRKKAFSTCSAHLTIVSVFYGSLIFVYAVPKKEALRAVEKIFSVFYIVLSPLINPLIYSLRNIEVKKALRRAVIKGSISK